MEFFISSLHLYILQINAHQFEMTIIVTHPFKIDFYKLWKIGDILFTVLYMYKLLLMVGDVLMNEDLLTHLPLILRHPTED